MILLMLLALVLVAVIEKVVRVIHRSRLYGRWMRRRGFVWHDDPDNARLGGWVKR